MQNKDFIVVLFIFFFFANIKKVKHFNVNCYSWFVSKYKKPFCKTFWRLNWVHLEFYFIYCFFFFAYVLLSLTGINDQTTDEYFVVILCVWNYDLNTRKGDVWFLSQFEVFHVLWPAIKSEMGFLKHPLT